MSNEYQTSLDQEVNTTDEDCRQDDLWAINLLQLNEKENQALQLALDSLASANKKAHPDLASRYSRRAIQGHRSVTQTPANRSQPNIEDADDLVRPILGGYGLEDASDPTISFIRHYGSNEEARAYLKGALVGLVEDWQEEK